MIRYVLFVGKSNKLYFYLEELEIAGWRIKIRQKKPDSIA